MLFNIMFSFKFIVHSDKNDDLRLRITTEYPLNSQWD